MSPTTSVVVNTLNEEANLPYALGSVRSWVDDIVVVDMESDDRTAEIARSFGARVFSHERLGFADPARQFAISQALGDWILILDADEMVPRRLAERLMAIAKEDVVDVVVIPWRNFVFGEPLKAGGWGPHQAAYPRFFRRGAVSTNGRVHDFLNPSSDARLLTLKHSSGLAMVHFNYSDVTQFLEKLNRYTSIEAEQAFARGAHPYPLNSIIRALLGFLKRYFGRGGFRDGWRGLYLALLMTSYRWAVAAKLRELQETGGRGPVIASYRAEAERLLSEYDDARTDPPDSDNASFSR